MLRLCRASRSSRLERSTIRAGWIPKCISIATARNSRLRCRKGAKYLLARLGSPTAVPTDARQGGNLRLAPRAVVNWRHGNFRFGCAP
jgi:hypothetical protein